MAEIVNLRQLRKLKARGAKDQAAEQNRALHGRTKAEKQRDTQTADAARTRLDSHRIERNKADSGRGGR
ncbi:DUF4169 family protein [Mesorhizobium sp. NBSH29]|uniref:DUF4169 family protein n=1 Tax=Mesorhizobium sp. NBSH29 TaxID=2654249 RepID=UPI0018966252|nr:DUF4169 family protein [Mesorhizobium sp. NBSH29]QPC88172.1 DUF4169 family protein [Mesorhizobium sp. NBSH29]